jgi:isopenicillin N synthase-like dioxygenase
LERGDVKDTEALQNYFKNQINQWPTDASSVVFQKIITDCWGAMSFTSQVLLQAISVSLGHAPDYFSQLHSKDDSTMELKRYQPMAPSHTPVSSTSDVMELYKKRKLSLKQEDASSVSYKANTSINDEQLDNDGSVVRVKSHADLSSITLLLQNDVDGLQVHSDGKWISGKSSFLL